MPHVPLSVPYFFFISSANAFSLGLSSNISVGSIPQMGSPVICVISSIVMETSLSSHTSPPCVTANSCLTHADAYWPLPKCGIFNNPRILVLSSPAAHLRGLVIVPPRGFTAIVSEKTCGASYGYFLSSTTSWSKNLSFPT
jgi:hypothetical protein